MTRLMETPPPVETAELLAALDGILSAHDGGGRRVVELARRPSPFSSSYALEELEATLDDGTSLQLMFKNLARDSMLAVARQTKPAFLYDPLREIETYRSVLASRRAGTPVCFGAVVDAPRARFWLFLERVSGPKLRHVGDLATWREVARWLARLHTEFAGEAASLGSRAAEHLLRYDEDFFRLWIGRAQSSLRRAGSASSSRDARHLDGLAAVYDRLVGRLASLPVTLVHGDFFASNVLTPETAGALRVCAVDWEMAGVGPGLVDLAALTAGAWSDEERAEIALSYYETLEPDGARPSSTDQFFTLLDFCHLHLAVQWLGWSEDWSPPADEAQDWLGVALRLTERLRQSPDAYARGASVGGGGAKEDAPAEGETRTRKIPGVDYKRAAVEYPQRIDAGHRHYLLTKPFYNLRTRHPKHRAFGLDVETQRYFCDFANIAVALDLEAGKRILDVGCGSGWLAEYFARLGYDVTGIDIAPELIEMSRERLERLPFEVDPETRLQYRFLVHDIESAPLEETFDAVICYDSLHHFEDEQAVFRHLSAMTADGGLLFILEGSKPPEGSATEQELLSVMGEFGTLESPYSSEYLRALLRRNGFFIVGDYVSVDGLYHRDMLRDGGLLPVSPQPVNYLLAKKVARGDAAGIRDSLHPGLLRARLTLVGASPERLHAGAAFEATLRIENVGDTIWLTGPTARRGAVTVGIKVLDEAGNVVAEVHDEPPLRRALAPGESVTSRIMYPLSLPCGNYTFKIDMVNQRICWFEQRGSEPLILPVRVVEPTPADH